jgi:MFS family permease
MGLYMKQIGMTRSQTGIIYGLMPFIGFLVRPLFGAIADKHKKHKMLLIISFILTGLCFNLMLFVPSKQLEHTSVKTEIMCSQADSYLRDCYRVNQTVNEQLCPISFHTYASKVKNALGKNTIVTNLSSGDHVPYAISTLPSAKEPISRSEVQCSLNCKYKSVPGLPQKVCFTNTTGTYNIADCYNVNLTPGKYESHLSITIPDLGYILNKEVIRDKVKVDDLICRDYDLKELVYNGQEYWQMLCSDDSLFDCNLRCTHIDTCVEIVAEELSRSSFWFFFALFLFGNIFFSPILSLGDAISYDLLGEERRNKWGKQRLWGTVGFALFAILSTLSMDTLRAETNANNFSIAFCMFSVLYLLTAFVVFTMKISHDLVCGQMLKGTMKILRNAKIFIFILVIFFFGILTGAIEAFLYWYLEADLGNKLKILPGLCVTFACLAETPVFYFAGRFIKRFGHVMCLYIAFVAYTVRFIGYSFLTNAWFVLPIELLHGLTFGLMWAAATSYGSIITPPGMSGTIQGLISGVHFGFGNYILYLF